MEVYKTNTIAGRVSDRQKAFVLALIKFRPSEFPDRSSVMRRAIGQLRDEYVHEPGYMDIENEVLSVMKEEDKDGENSVEPV